MIGMLKKIFKRDFPRKIRGHWSAGEWFLHLADGGSSEDWPVEGKVVFDPLTTGVSSGYDGKNFSRCIDGLIPAVRKGDTIGLYRLTRRYRMNGGRDLDYWDDGMKNDLTLVKTIRQE